MAPVLVVEESGVPGENHREIDAPNTRVHSRSLSAIDTEYTDTSIKSGGVKQDNTCFRCDQPNV